MLKKKTIEDELLEAKKTAAVSKERLKRITKTRKHHLRNGRRVVKYGVKSFVRNTWLSVAAIAIMVVTLVVLSATLIAANAMRMAMDQVANRVDISIYLKQGASQSQIYTIVNKIKKLDDVAEVSVLSPEEANKKINDKIIKEFNITDKDQIQAMREAPNKIAWTLNVKMRNLEATSELENFVNNDEDTQALLDETKKPTFASSHREAIENITTIMNRVRIIGLSAAGVFAIIAILVVFNTIRMAIFNRKEEIYMMRLVGASRGFIVGPFVVEASIYGIVAAIIASGTIYGAVYGLRPSFDGMLDSTFELMVQYWYLVVAALMAAGILIGVVSSLLATGKYLKQK
jgi:cell division transport system permease protein